VWRPVRKNGLRLARLFQWQLGLADPLRLFSRMGDRAFHTAAQFFIVSA
jgi:hypothetical protein